MFKIFNKESNNKQKQSRSQSASMVPFEELAERTYQIDYNNLWKLSSQESEEIILKQEKYIANLRKNYQDQLEELEPVLQKVNLLNGERIKLMDELEEYKIKYADLKKNLEISMSIPQKDKQINKADLSELKDTLNVILQDLIREAHREDGIDSEELESNIEESVDQFIEGIPKNYIKSGENEEIKRLREQAEKLTKEIQRLFAENNQLSQQLIGEKAYREKLLQQNQSIQQENDLLQKDIINFSDALRKEKDKCAYLESKCQEFQNRGQNLTNEVSNAVEEKETIKQQLMQTIKTLETQIKTTSEENLQLRSQFKDLQTSFQKEEDNMMMKWQDFDNKLVQEKLKLDQKIKECNRLEEQLKEAKNQIASLSDQNNEHQQNIQILKEKRENDRKIMEDQKQKMKSCKQETKEIEEKLKNQILKLEEQLSSQRQLQDQEQKNEKISQLVMEKDIQISKLEQEILNLQNRFNEVKQNNAKLQVSINDQREENGKLVAQVKFLQEKREFGKSEIDRLTSLNEALKEQVSELKNQNNQKISITQTVQQQQDLDSSQLSQKSAQNSEKPVTTKIEKFNPHAIQEPLTNRSLTLPKNLFQAGISLFSGRKKAQKNVTNEDMLDRKQAEQVLILQGQDLKQSVEQLYKSYVKADLTDYKTEMPLIERRINECLKKTQDLLDNIEDFTQVK